MTKTKKMVHHHWISSLPSHSLVLQAGKALLLAGPPGMFPCFVGAFAYLTACVLRACVRGAGTGKTALALGVATVRTHALAS